MYGRPVGVRNTAMMLPSPTATQLSGRFVAALDYARQLHGQQVRKGTQTPYIAHLLSVTALVLEDGGDEDEAIAALLHDAIEDQGGSATRAEILRRFGPRVTTIVDGCTDADTIPKPPWRSRKLAYLQHLQTASAEILRISNADKLHNVRAILSDYRQLGEALWERFNGGKEGTLWYYRALANTFGRLRSGPLVDELLRAVAELEQLCQPPSAEPT